ncbi:MAG: hypothetical protein FWG88_06500 [Oscillospiraceae bacterium]|nr:hypothetical protein [Oscillospiraceae bacterium]
MNKRYIKSLLLVVCIITVLSACSSINKIDDDSTTDLPENGSAWEDDGETTREDSDSDASEPESAIVSNEMHEPDNHIDETGINDDIATSDKTATSGETVTNEEQIPSTPVDTPAQIYTFYDEAIQNAIEMFLDKNAEDFTAADLEYLSGLDEFSFDLYYMHMSITSLRDLPELFVNLRKVKLSYSWFNAVELSESDIAILDGMPQLQSVDIFANGLPSLDFIQKIPYAAIRYTTDAYSSSDNNLATASVLGKEVVESNFDGSIREYVKVTDGDLVYELLVSDEHIQEEGELINNFLVAKVFISEKRDGVYHIIESYPVYGRNVTASAGLILVDVDFDGNNDILVMQGHFGNQGLVTYDCYLNRGDTYVRNESFSHISNPSHDVLNSKILSVWRNWAASHSWAMYSYINGEFVETDRLTTEPEIYGEMRDDGLGVEVEVWKITIERFYDGMIESDSYFSNEYTDEEWNAMFYQEDSYWGLLSNRWNTLHNQGTMFNGRMYG